jgi:hypothetical protein
MNAKPSILFMENNLSLLKKDFLQFIWGSPSQQKSVNRQTARLQSFWCRWKLLTIPANDFPIRFRQGFRIFHMWCELTETGQTFDKFTLWPKDKPYKILVLQKNRPLIRKKVRLKTKIYSWKVISGTKHQQEHWMKPSPW